MALQNKWVNYITRSYDQIKEAILAKFPADVPELTDLSLNNIFVRMVSVWAGIAEMLGYYIDVAARELYLPTARYYASAVKSAKMFGYNIHGLLPSRMTATFTLNAAKQAPIVFPIYTIIRDKNGIEFITLNEYTLEAGETTLRVATLQGVWRSLRRGDAFVPDGRPGQKVLLPDDASTNILEVSFNAEIWKQVDSFYGRGATDKVYVVGINEEGKPQIEFGDGVEGLIPAVNIRNVRIRYVETKGTLGNVLSSDGLFFSSYDEKIPTEDITIANTDATGGNDRETLQDLKRNIPASLRTLNRGVTLKDIEDLTLLTGRVSSVRVRPSYDDIEIYIISNGDALITTQEFKDELLQDLTDKMQNLVLLNYKIKDVYPFNIRVSFRAKLLPDYNAVLLEEQLKSDLISHVDLLEIGGVLAPSNIYSVIEERVGIDYADQFDVKYDLFLEGRGSGRSLDVTDFVVKNRQDREFPTFYLLTILHSNSTRFELARGGFEKRQYTFDYPITDNPDFSGTFTKKEGVNYRDGDSWDFYIYNTDRTIDLKTISKFKLADSDITINT